MTSEKSRSEDGDIDEGPLPVRLLIISTILLALLSFAVITLSDPDTVDSIRQSFSSVFG